MDNKLLIDIEYTRKYDVAVIGGGTTGCAAALSAAREGAKVAIIHVSPLQIYKKFKI